MIEHESLHLALEGMPGFTKRLVFQLLQRKYTDQFAFIGAKISDDRNQIIVSTRPDLFTISSPPDTRFPMVTHLDYLHLYAEEWEKVIHPLRHQCQAVFSYRSLPWSIWAYYTSHLDLEERQRFQHLKAEVGRNFPAIWADQVFYLRVTEEQAIQSYMLWQQHQRKIVTLSEIERLKQVLIGYEEMAEKVKEKCEILDGNFTPQAIVSRIQDWIAQYGIVPTNRSKS